MAWSRSRREPRARGPRAVEDAFREALARVLRQDLAGAEEALSSIVRGDSDQIEAYLDLAEVYRNRGEIGRAIRVHQNLLLRSDLSAAERERGLLGLAEDFRQGGFLQRAIAAYEELLERRPKLEEALRPLIRLHADARNHDRAIELQRRLAKQTGAGGQEEGQLLLDAAEAAHAEGRSDDARKLMKRALRRGGEEGRALTLAGAIEAERGRSKQALAAWSKAAMQDPRCGPALYTRIEAAYAALDRSQEFETWLRGAIEARPDDRAARLALVRSLAARGDTDAALSEAGAMCEHDPDDLAALAAAARVALAAGREKEALAAIGPLLELLERRGLLVEQERLR